MSKVFNDINSLISGARSPDEFIEEVAAEFHALSETANSRLSAVVSLLADGYRDEAIQMAEQEPKLLPSLAQLDFRQREEWVTYVTARGLDAPPKLNHDAAEVIEEAYEQQRKLEPLMRKHRLLALARAPLPARLQVLRWLEQADPTNPIWAGDIERFEHSRIEQIRQAATLARKNNDVKGLADLAEELNQPWSIKVPADLRNFVAGSSGDLSRRAAIEQLKPVAAKLNAALMAFDAESGRAAREEWLLLNETARVAPGDPLHSETEEALRWLDEVDQQEGEEEAYEEALSKLERGLDDELSLEEIDQLWYAVRKFNRDVPDSLERRVTEYKERLLAARQRRSMLRMATAAAAVLAVGALFWLYLFNQGRQRALAEARSQAASFREANNLSGFDTWFAGLAEFIKKDGDVLNTRQGLQDNVNQIAQLQEDFSQTLGEIDLKGPLEEAVDAALAKAAGFTEELAKRKANPGQLTDEIESTKRKVEAERERRLRERTTSFREGLSELAQDLKEVEQIQLSADPKSRLESLKNSLNEFRGRHLSQVDRRPAVETAALDQVGLLLQRVENRLKAVAEYKSSLERVSVITAASNDPEAFAKALLAFAGDFPGSPWSSDFRKSAAEASAWKNLSNWQSLAQKPDWVKICDLNKAEAAGLLKSLESAEKALVLPEFASRLNSVKALLDQIQKGRAISKEEVIKKITETYSKEDYQKQSILVERGEREPNNWRYLRGSFRANPERKSFNYDFYGNIFRQDKQVKVGRSLPADQVAQAGLAGQCFIADELLRVVGKSGAMTTEDLLLELAKIVIADYPADDPVKVDQPRTAPDPIVQAVMTQVVFQLCSDGSPAIAEAIKADLVELNAGQFSSVDWFEGDNSETVAKRKEAEKLLESVRNHQNELGTQVAAWRKRALEAADWADLNSYRWAGWLRLGDGAPEIINSARLENGQELFVLVPTGAANEATFRSVGIYANGTLENSSAAELFQSGRPVFFKQSKIKTESDKP